MLSAFPLFPTLIMLPAALQPGTDLSGDDRNTFGQNRACSYLKLNAIFLRDPIAQHSDDTCAIRCCWLRNRNRAPDCKGLASIVGICVVPNGSV